MARQLKKHVAIAAQMAAILWEMVGALVHPGSPPLVEAHAEVEGRLGPVVPWSGEIARRRLLAWADNLFIVAASSEHAIERAPCHKVALVSLELSISPSSAEAFSDRHCEAMPPGTRLEAACAQQREELTCVGIALDAVGSTATMVRHRLEESD